MHSSCFDLTYKKKIRVCKYGGKIHFTWLHQIKKYFILRRATFVNLFLFKAFTNSLVKTQAKILFYIIFYKYYFSTWLQSRKCTAPDKTFYTRILYVVQSILFTKITWWTRLWIVQVKETYGMEKRSFVITDYLMIIFYYWVKYYNYSRKKWHKN